MTQDKAALVELAERCEAAGGLDRVTDVEIQIAVHGDKRYGAITGNKHQIIGWGTLSGYLEAFCDVINADDAIDDEAVPRFTASLDAALTLVPEGMIWLLTNTGVDNPTKPDFSRSTAVVGEWQATGQLDNRSAATPALALCAAALKALANQEPSQ